MNTHIKSLLRREKAHQTRHFWLRGAVRNRHRRRRLRQQLYMTYRKGA